MDVVGVTGDKVNRTLGIPRGLYGFTGKTENVK